jgi:hypothetical protein
LAQLRAELARLVEAAVAEQVFLGALQTQHFMVQAAVAVLQLVLLHYRVTTCLEVQ